MDLEPTNLKNARLGLAGLGTMGTPMAAHLARLGQSLCLYDIDSARMHALHKELASVNSLLTTCQTAAELGQHCDVLITMLPDARCVAELLNGTDNDAGAGKTLQSQALVIDMSSSDPLATQELGKTLEEQGITLLDAPVSGGVRKAIAGTLAIMLGGDNNVALDVAENLLQCMGSVFRTGALGSGHATKALNNYVSAAGLAAASEAALIGAKFGLDPNLMIDVINASTGYNNSTQNKMKPFVLNDNFSAAGFSLGLMAKDVATAAELAQQLQLNLPGVDQARTLWQQAQQALADDADHTEIYRYLSRQGIDKN